jgi:hypothetical protein
MCKVIDLRVVLQLVVMYGRYRKKISDWQQKFKKIDANLRNLL